MKQYRKLATGLTVAALALACSSTRTQAQNTIITNTYTFNFPTTGPTEGPFPDTTWIYWYNQPPSGGAITTDPTTDASNPVAGANTSDSGSLMVVSPLDETVNEQDVFFGTFADSGSYNTSVQADTTKFASISCDILVAPGTPLSSAGNYGAIQVGVFIPYSFIGLNNGTVTIPASAVSNWFHVSVPIDQTQGLGDVSGIAFNINSYGGYPKFTITNWIDNISINGSTAPPPPPPTLLGPEVPVVGMNFIDTTPTSQYDRYQIANTNDNAGGLSFVGQSSVTYSFNIAQFPSEDQAYSYQAHFFIVSGSDNTNTVTTYPDQYDQAADYNLANCIFVTIQSDGNGGGICNFRYKTNEIDGNGMLFNTSSPTSTNNPNGWPIMPIVGFDSAPLLGTWSFTFASTTNITITSPSGATTNFSIDPASAQLFADPCTLILGAQPNNAGDTGLPNTQDVVYSSFSLTGTPAAYTDNFLADSSLNTNYWENLSSDLAGAQLISSNAAYWVGWTLPAPGYSLAAAPSLTAPWSSVTPLTTVKDGITMFSLIGTNGLPGAEQGYFALIQRTFSQLLILLPGETNAPNTATGKVGTPNPDSYSLTADGGVVEIPFTVMAVDSHFNPVPGIIDTLSFSDGNGGIFETAPYALVNGVGNFQVYYENAANNVVITATDTTSTNIPAASSSQFNITQ